MTENDSGPRYGANCYQWKGDAVGYRAAHDRVRKARGKASTCVFGCVSRFYVWANLTDQYHDLDDYAPMCQSCHLKFDNARRAMEPGFVRQPSGTRFKFTEEQRAEMRILGRAGLSRQLIARIHLASPAQVGRIVSKNPSAGKWS
jgi:hypothetical protein